MLGGRELLELQVSVGEEGIIGDTVVCWGGGNYWRYSCVLGRELLEIQLCVGEGVMGDKGVCWGGGYGRHRCMEGGVGW